MHKQHAARPSTRIHAPPGGASSFSLGNSSPIRPRKVDQVVQKKPDPATNVSNLKPTTNVSNLNPTTNVSNLKPESTSQMRRASAHAMHSSSIFSDENAAPQSSGRGVRQAPGAGMKSSFSLG